jgi:Selenocysteine lyase
MSVSNFIHSPSSNNIIFTKSATEGINLVSSCLSNNYFKDGDEVISYGSRTSCKLSAMAFSIKKN